MRYPVWGYRKEHANGPSTVTLSGRQDPAQRLAKIQGVCLSAARQANNI